MKRAVVSVINDLSTDQRVHKHCVVLTELGYDVLLIGRVTKNSVPMQARAYETLRMKLPFEKGPLFYASFNVALFMHLLFRKANLYFSNDLDTLIPNYLISKVKRKPLVYDSHEYFTEVPELVNRPVVQQIWKRIERSIVPRLKWTFTVNNSISEFYERIYGIKMRVVRNVPILQQTPISKTRTELGLPIDKHIIILQGSGINVDRGAEEAVEAMKKVDGAILLIIGAGDVIAQLKEMVIHSDLESKVIFKDRMPYDQMMAHTYVADLGLTLDKDSNVNYRYSLPNKLFDYVHAEIPILASNLKEVSSIVESYDLGDTVLDVTSESIAQKIDEMLSSPKRELWKRNCRKAKDELNWGHESIGLKQTILSIDD